MSFLGLSQKASSKSDNFGINKLINKNFFLKNLSKESLDLILNVATLITKPKDTIVFLHGDPADSLYILSKGIIGNYSRTEEGKQILLKLVLEGEHFGETSLIPNAYYPYTAQALSECELLKIPFHLIQKYLLQNPDITHSLMSTVIYSLHEYAAYIGQRYSLSAAQRLGCYLLKSVDGNKAKTITTRLPVHKNTIADYLRMAPETFSRALLKLKIIEVEFKRSKVIIKDLKKLSEFCRRSCPRISSPIEKECKSCSINN